MDGAHDHPSFDGLLTGLTARVEAAERLLVEHETRITALETGEEPIEPEPPIDPPEQPDPPDPPPGEWTGPFEDLTDWQTRLRPDGNLAWAVQNDGPLAGGMLGPITDDGTHLTFTSPSRNYRSELQGMDTALPAHNVYRQYMSYGVEYAVAYPFHPSPYHDEWHYVCQMWNSHGGVAASPPTTLSLENGQVKLFTRTNPVNSWTIAPLEDREYRIVMNFRWQDYRDANALPGFFSVYLDSVQKMYEPRGLNYTNSWAPFLKIGIYRTGWGTLTHTNRVRKDGFGIFAGTGCLDAALAHVQ